MESCQGSSWWMAFLVTNKKIFDSSKNIAFYRVTWFKCFFTIFQYYHCFAWLRWRLLLQVIQAYTYSGHQKKHQELSVRQCQSQISQWHRPPCQGRSEVTHSSDSTPQSTSTRPAWSRWMEIAGAIDMTENAKLLLYKSLFLPCQKDVFSSGNPTDRVSLA
jgi:hypothetical protein